MEWIASSVFGRLIEHIRDISKMSVASWTATAVDFLIFSLLHRFLDVQISTATALGSLGGAMVHFSICRLWIFNSTMKHSFAESVWRYIIVIGGALILHSTGTTLLAKYVIHQEELAWLISKNTVFLCWVYPGTKYMVFGQRRQSQRQHRPQLKPHAPNDNPRDRE